MIGLSSGAVAIATGLDNSCALTASGGVKCWGLDEYGQLGDGGATSHQPSPVDVVGLTSGVKAISASGNDACALLTGGGVKCWGDDGYGQLGDGGGPSRATPVDVVGMTSGVAAISTGAYDTCALMTAGTVKCWGRNEVGGLGDGTTTPRSGPVDVVGLPPNVTSISVGSEHACAVTSKGGIDCWGGNGFGELGDGTTTERLKPVQVVGFGG